MTKPLTVEKRLTEIENRVSELSGDALIHGIIAKAHSSTPYDALMDDGDALTPDARRLNQCVNRLDKLEPRFTDLYNHVIGKPPAQDDDQEALGVLAKAQSASLRKGSAAGILERAQKVLTDPTQFGIVESHVQAGQFRKAAEMLEAHERRADESDENASLERMEGQLKNHEQMVAVSELAEKMGSFEGSLNSILNRLAKLERPANAPVQESAATVAKAHGKKRQQQEADYADTVSGLMDRAQACIDSPSLMGQISSMLQSGDATQIEQVRQKIEGAELRAGSRFR